jgi:hypothetical protein
MKTAKEWMKEGYFRTSEDCIGWIKKIQADALRHAAMLCANSDNHLCGIAAIENEANKLEAR